jgi:hypothetical protein
LEARGELMREIPQTLTLIERAFKRYNMAFALGCGRMEKGASTNGQAFSDGDPAKDPTACVSRRSETISGAANQGGRLAARRAVFVSRESKISRL